MFYTNVPINQSNRVYLERPRVDRILEEAVKQPVVFVCAGVGYGKTQAVYSFLRKRRYIIVWIQFSGRDNIAARFWENITGAIGALHPDSARQLTEIGFPDTSRKFEYYLKIPQKEILPGSKYIFVYDNLQLIRDRKALRFLEQTITLPFPNITSILISRGEPQLNTEKLFFGQAPRITEDELRFTLEETAAFFELQRLKTGPETVALVYRDTEGWAFATYLAALALNRDSANYAESHRLIGVRSNIFKLIEKEIMEGMDPALRKFLIKLSLMDHFAPELLRDIQGEENPLERLESLGAFFQFDAYLNAYRIHPLFLEFLAGKQDELPAEEKRETYQKAAEWCIKNGQKIDAFIYLEKAEDYDRFFFAVHEAFPLIVPEPVARALLAICEKAPEAAYERNPGLYVLYTWMLITLRFFTRAKADLREIIGKLKTRKLSGINKWALRGCYINMGLCGYFTGAYMRDYSFTDNFDLASRYNDASLSAARQPGFVAQVAFCACRVYSPEKGEFEKAIAVLDKMVPCLAGAYNGCAWGLDDLARSEFALLRGKLDEAEGHAQEALRKARERSQYEIEDRAMFFLLRIGLARGDGRTAGETFRLIEERPDTPGFGNQHILRDIVGGWFYVQTGRRGRVAAWLKSDFEESDLNSVLNGAETLIKARY
ncbi:MAG: helix-turn-helix transcriptional regulator, partial [Spirochaetaceae bacterium]|nr:helix-turn-helix transcriptional regulator [Spirochaetaceae bacterium]